MTFNKSDNGKPRFGLIPPLAELEVVKVLNHGGDRYGDENWRRCDNWCRYVDALGRHFNAYRRGERNDIESGRHHLAHLICCALFLLEHEMAEPERRDAEKATDGPEIPGLLPPWACEDCG